MSEDLEWRERNGKKKRATKSAAPPRAQLSDRALLEALLDALQRVEQGDFEVRLDAHGRGLNADLARSFNTVVLRSQKLSEEMVRVERVVGREGRTTERVSLGTVDGGWARSVVSINTLIG